MSRERHKLGDHMKADKDVDSSMAWDS